MAARLLLLTCGWASTFTTALLLHESSGGGAGPPDAGRAPRDWCSFLIVDGPHPRVDDVRTIAALAGNASCTIHIMFMGEGGCRHYPDIPNCRERRNVGRDLGAATRFILEHYDNLPERFGVTSSNINKWGRIDRLRALLADLKSTHFDCPNNNGWAPSIGDDAGFSIKCYDGTELTPAEPYGMLNWAMAHIDKDQRHYNNVQQCFNGMWRTTRALLLERHRDFYEKILSELEVSASNEAVHYAERMASIIYGGYTTAKERNAQQAHSLIKTAPAHCHVAIVVPYRPQPGRERHDQLMKLETTFWWILENLEKRRGCTSNVVVVEQSNDRRRFNRGYAINVGYLIAKEKAPKPITSFIVHDVDLFPNDDSQYAQQPGERTYLHLAHTLAKYPDENFFGGVFAMTPATFEMINGFPNDCWDCGLEDQVVAWRCRASDVSLRRTCTGNWKDMDVLNFREDVKKRNIAMKERLKPLYKDFLDAGDAWRQHGLNSVVTKIAWKGSFGHNNTHIVIDIPAP